MTGAHIALLRYQWYSARWSLAFALGWVALHFTILEIMIDAPSRQAQDRIVLILCISLGIFAFLPSWLRSMHFRPIRVQFEDCLLVIPVKRRTVVSSDFVLRLGLQAALSSGVAIACFISFGSHAFLLNIPPLICACTAYGTTLYWVVVCPKRAPAAVFGIILLLPLSLAAYLATSGMPGGIALVSIIAITLSWSLALIDPDRTGPRGAG